MEKGKYSRAVCSRGMRPVQLPSGSLLMPRDNVKSTHAHSVDDSISICPLLGKVDTVVATWKVFTRLPVRKDGLLKLLMSENTTTWLSQTIGIDFQGKKFSLTNGTKSRRHWIRQPELATTTAVWKYAQLCLPTLCSHSCGLRMPTWKALGKRSSGEKGKSTVDSVRIERLVEWDSEYSGVLFCRKNVSSR